jgi:hypothetical protein
MIDKPPPMVYYYIHAGKLAIDLALPIFTRWRLCPLSPVKNAYRKGGSHMRYFIAGVLLFVAAAVLLVAATGYIMAVKMR